MINRPFGVSYGTVFGNMVSVVSPRSYLRSTRWRRLPVSVLIRFKARSAAGLERIAGDWNLRLFDAGLSPIRQYIYASEIQRQMSIGGHRQTSSTTNLRHLQRFNWTVRDVRNYRWVQVVFYIFCCRYAFSVVYPAMRFLKRAIGVTDTGPPPPPNAFQCLYVRDNSL